MAAATLEVRNLTTWFPSDNGPVKAVDGIDYTVRPGRALAIVGESGSGKSVGVRSLLGLLPSSARVVAGEALLDGTDLLRLSRRQLRQTRGRRVAMVFQNAMEAMNPTLTLQRQLTEHLLWHRVCGRDEARRRAVRALGDVGIPEPERRIRMYPFQLSGGMRQRAMIAMATVTEPDLLIADEPTTAVDVTVQRQILDLLKSFKHRGTTIVMITHDLGVARYFCDDVVVMYAGKVMEHGPLDRVLGNPRHPYTRGLLDSTLELGEAAQPLRSIPGNPPDLARRPEGCPFHPRCALAEPPSCKDEQTLVQLEPDRRVACWKVGVGDA